jgi:SAM-dependent methyltransferase
MDKGSIIGGDLTERIARQSRMYEDGPLAIVEPARVDTAVAYDMIAPEYDATFSTPLALAENTVAFEWVNRHYRELCELAAAARPQYPVNVLDVACGTGLLLDYIDIPGSTYQGIDISHGMLAQARRKHPRHMFYAFEAEHLAALPMRSGYALAVSMFGSWSHFDAARVVDQLWRVMRSGGRVLIMAMSRRYAHRESYILQKKGLKVDRRLWRSDDLRNLFERRGFAQVKIHGMDGYADPHMERWGWSQPAIERYLRAERATLGRLLPDRCFNLCLEAVRPYTGVEE